MNAKLARRWRSRGLREKGALLLGAAALLTLLAETLCNARALTTAGLEPVAVALTELTVDSDLSVEQYPDGITFELGENRLVDLIVNDVGQPLTTVRVELSGEGVTYVAVSLTDEASAEAFQQAYGVYCVASDPALSVCYATARSAGDARRVRIRLKPRDNGVTTVTGVTLNAPVPFTWQWPRMALSFAVAFGLLCALILRGVNAAYDPSRWPHRLIVALPLCALMALAPFVAQWIEPDAPLFSGVTDEQAAAGEDAYAVLYEAFRAGRLSVEPGPGEALSALENPYDQSARLAEGVGFRFDYAYYGGRYYVYYGVAPVLTVYAPFRALTGRVPASRDAALILSWLTIVFIGWAMCGLTGRYAPEANVFRLSLGCAAAAVSAGVFVLLSSADFYYLAELSYVCFAAGAIAFGLSATLAGRRRLAALRYALSGVCFALAAMSRPGALPMLAAFLAPLFVTELIRRRARLPQAAAFLIPAAAGVGAILWYNAARFGSALDFGATYQLTVTDMRFSALRLSEWPDALYHYLLEPLEWNNRFPYLSLAYHASPAAGRYVFTLSNAGVLVFPVTWAAALWPLEAARFPAATRGAAARARLDAVFAAARFPADDACFLRLRRGDFPLYLRLSPVFRADRRPVRRDGRDRGRHARAESARGGRGRPVRGVAVRGRRPGGG
jgi:hypothetical protein